MPRPRKSHAPGSPNYSVPDAPHNPGRQPIRVPTGLPFGEAKKLEDAQRAVPLGTSHLRAVPDAVYQAAQAYQAPSIGLGRTSDRASEPVTAGLDIGAGPGSEDAVAPGVPTADPDLVTAVAYLPVLEQIASLPDSSVAMRNYVRRLRGAAGQLDQPPTSGAVL